MDCKTFALLLDVSPEERDPQQQRNEPCPQRRIRNAQQQKEMDEHMKVCPECAMLFALRQDCKTLHADEELPPEFTMGWRMKVRREEAMEMKQAKRRMNWQRLLSTAAAVVFVFAGATISYVNGWGMPESNKTAGTLQARGVQSNYMLTGGAPMMDTYTANNESVMMTKSSSDGAAVQEAKIIRTINYAIKTNQYEADFAAIKELAAENGGYIESLSSSGDVMSGEMRYAHFTLRVPSDKLDAFLGSAKNVGVATSYSEHSEDVSSTYYDIAARLETQQAKMTRLNELLGQATNMSDLIEIESAISDTQYQIDRYTGQLKGYDSRINDSYVYVSLQEITSADMTEMDNVTLKERIVNAVKASVEAMGEFAQAAAVFAVAALPWCAVLAVIAIVIKIVRRTKKSEKG